MPILLAFIAILLWSSLALFGARLAHLPSLLLLGLAFLPAGLYSLLRPRAWRVPPLTLTVGFAGLFGYHFLYFRAFALAPAVEANLINYLWPLLIVLLSPLVLPGFYLRPRHVLAGLLGLAGAGLIVTGGRLSLDQAALPGYLCAAGAALTWALYSLLTKRLPPFPSETVGAFCALASLAAFAGYALTLGEGLPQAHLPWQDAAALLLAGLGPMGAAFFFWDAALKRGDPRTIGSLAYLTPLLSTLNLLAFAGQRLSPLSLVAMLLILAGAALGALPAQESVAPQV